MENGLKETTKHCLNNQYKTLINKALISKHPLYSPQVDLNSTPYTLR